MILGICSLGWVPAATLSSLMGRGLAAVSYMILVHGSWLTVGWGEGYGLSGPSVSHHLPEFPQVHVYCIGDAIQPSHSLMPSFSSALNLSQQQGLFQ